MLLSIQFPFADFRNFLDDTGRLPVPNWLFPNPDSDFIHYFGSIRYRKGGGAAGWVGENKICEAQRAIRFDDNPGQLALKVNLNVPLECAYRRFFFDGWAVGKYEVGINSREDKSVLTETQTRALVDHLLHFPVRVPPPAREKEEETAEKMGQYELGRAGRPLAQLYALATTTVPKNAPKDVENWWVTPGPPLLFLEYRQKEDVALPAHAQRVTLPQSYAMSLYYYRFAYAGGAVPMWVLGVHATADYDRARTLRLYLLRLHAEHVCLGLTLRNMLAGNIDVEYRSDASNSLQRYLRKATRRIREHESRSTEKFSSEVAAIARQSMNLMLPGEYEQMQEVLERFRPRPAAEDDVNDYLIGPELAKLRRFLLERFSISELKDLCWDLGIDYELLDGQGKRDKVRELIDYFRRRGRVSELVEAVKALRPNAPITQN